MREGGAIGELGRFRPRFPLKSAYVVENSRVKKTKILTLYEGKIQRRLSVEASELLTPPPPIFSFGG